MKVMTLLADSQFVSLIVDEVEEFKYLGSRGPTTGGIEQLGCTGRLRKARTVIRAMDKLWKSKIVGSETEI